MDTTLAVRLEQGLLGWVDEYIQRVRPWIHVRERDGLLIKRPNEAVKLNPTGARILRLLLDGVRIRELLTSLGTEERVGETVRFLHDIRRHLDGGLAPCRALAMEKEPLGINFSPLPVLAELAVAASCNLRCRFCYGALGTPSACAAGSGGHRAHPAGSTLDADGYRRLIRLIHDEADIPSLSFTGGEPTLNPDLPELIACAAGLGMRVNLITNGTLVDTDTARRFADAGLASAQVSIEAPEPARHEALTGVPGSFAASCAGLAALAAAGVSVHPHTTLTGYNLGAAVAMPAFAASLGAVRCSMNLLIPTGSALADTDLDLRYETVGPVVLAVQAAAATARIAFHWYSPTPLCLFNPIAHGLGNKGCAACDGLLAIAPDGALLPCSSFPERLGNLLTDGFEAAWHAPRAAALRAKTLAPPACHRCPDFTACHGACPLYFARHGFAEIEATERYREACACAD